MSRPRFTFFGQFQADVSTVNNDVRHFANKHFEPRFQMPRDGPVMNGWWNPEGTGSFRLLNVTVRQAISTSGPVETDPIVGLTLADQVDRTSAKLVDLDPQFQMASAIWGLRLVLTDGKTDFMRGNFLPASFRDLFFGRTFVDGQPLPGSGGASAKFTSVLTDVEWDGAAHRSPVLASLRAASVKSGNVLSIALMTFAFGAAGQFMGHVSGAIGPWTADSPRRFVAGRRFSPANGFAQTDGIGFFDADVSDVVTVDLSNALPLDGRDGRLLDIGAIQLAVLLVPDQETGTGTPQWALVPGITESAVVGPNDLVILGDIPYRASNWLQDSGGIVDFPATPAVNSLLDSRPLALVQPIADGRQRVLIRENVGGYFLRVDDFVLRKDAVKNASVEVPAAITVTKFGKPAPGIAIALSQVGQEDNQGGSSGTDPTPPRAPIPPIGVPIEKLHAPAMVATGSSGSVIAPISIDDPGNPRGYIDGQIYKINFRIAASGASALPRLEKIFIHVRDAYEPPKNPGWEADIKPIMEQFGNVYPIMSKGLFSFSDPQILEAHTELLIFAFERPIADPNHMPVTRDLSQGKRAAIVSWLKSLQGKQEMVAAGASAALAVSTAVASDSAPALPVEPRSTLPAEEVERQLALLGNDMEGKAPAYRNFLASVRKEDSESGQ